MKDRFQVGGLQALELADLFPFTKGCRTLRIKGGSMKQEKGTLLFDLEQDTGQLNPLSDPQIEGYMAGHLARLMQVAHAPKERLGLNPWEGGANDCYRR
jgi:hypothetical protein